MNLKGLADTARRAIEDRGGTDRLKQDADRLREIAMGPGSITDKAKAAGDALRQPAASQPGTRHTDAETAAGSRSGDAAADSWTQTESRTSPEDSLGEERPR